jgi:dihydroorotase
MSVLIKQAKIIDPDGPHHHKTMDVLIEGGKISEIKKTISSKASKLVEVENLCISIGWLDMQATFCDLGHEHKETIESGIKSAAAGGFTGVCIHSSNSPSLSSKSQIEYIKIKADNKVVDVYPFGTITQKQEGKDLAELYDMQLAGAAGFSDYKNPITNAGLMMRALQYSSNINAVIAVHCNEDSLSHGGQMNEGETAMQLGLKGMPAIAEEINLAQHIAMLEYSGGRLHVSTISTKGSVELIKKAKSAGLPITAGVAAINLFKTDSELEEFDSNYKLDPPLRTKKDVDALRKALENGVIDVIVSDHQPQDVESKQLEFDLADFGAIQLQTAFQSALAGLKEDNVDVLIKALAHRPRQILGLPQLQIKEGEVANLTLFSMREDFLLTEKNNKSLSKNSPFMNVPLNGKVIGVINGGKSAFNPEG